MKEHADLTFAYVAERDVDSLVVEELECSAAFRRWFLDSVVEPMGRPKWTSIDEPAARHSVTAPSKAQGETDVEFGFTSDGRRTLILIENKIDAPFQPRQAERYRERAVQLCESGECTECLTVLLAPDEYLTSTSGCEEFDVTVSYEQMRGHFLKRGQGNDELARRCRYRVGVLDQAINRYRRGYTAIPDETMTKFWSAYYQQARQTAPELGMARPGAKPAGSTFICFVGIEQQPGLPRCLIVHKFTHGYVDLELAGLAGHLEELESSLRPVLAEEMHLRRAGRSLAVTIDVPVLSVEIAFEEQAAAAGAGIRAAMKLRSWLLEHSGMLRRVLTDSRPNR